MKKVIKPTSLLQINWKHQKKVTSKVEFRKNSNKNGENRVQIHILLLFTFQSMTKCPLSFAWKPLSECMVGSGGRKRVRDIARNFFVSHNSLPPAYLTNRKLADEDKRWRVLIPLRKIEAFVRSEQILEVKHFWDRSV